MRASNHLVFAIIVTTLAGIADAGELAIFDGSEVAPYRLMVGDKENWATPVTEGSTVSAAGYVSVETDADGAKSASWNGKGEAQLYLAAAEPQDLSAAAAADAALVLLLKVDQPPKRKTFLRMGCGYPCAANADISPLLKALPKEEWLRVSIDLKCFVDGGLNVANVDTPFLILTRGKMSLSVSDVRIVDGAGPGATINCR